MNTTIIIGANGQLGQCLKKVARDRAIVGLVFPEEASADILNFATLTGLFEREQPTYIINCAAYTAVDKAEVELEKAAAINETGARNLALLCEQFGSTLIHISTDFVFEGKTVKLLKETDDTAPINVYGLTKLNGEVAIRNDLAQHVIIRTSWLYSEYANNFLKTMLKLGAERDQLNIIADQIGTPTYAIDLAKVIFDIIAEENKVYGTFHYSNEGVTSWYDFAKAIFELAALNVQVSPIPTEKYPTPAKRPSFSVMDKTKIKETYQIAIPYWRDSLKACIAQIKSNSTSN